MKSSNENLISKLSAFVSDYYRDKLARGLVFTVIILSVTGLIILFLEYLFRFNSIVRSLLFFGFGVFALVILFYYVVWPMLALLGIRKPLSKENAARFIGEKLSNVDDRLLNRLQLEHVSHSDLVEASRLSIERQLTNVDFGRAIEKGWIKIGAGILLFAVALYGIVSYVKPEILTEGSKRLVEYDVAHHLIPPFHVDVDFKEVIKRGEPLVIKVAMTGNELPNTVEVLYEDITLYAAESGGVFSKSLLNTNESGSFMLQLGKYQLGPFNFKVISNPELLSGKVSLDFPQHTSLESSVVGLEEVLSIPEGTSVKWKFDLVDSENGMLVIDSAVKVNTQQWTSKAVLDSTISYTLHVDDDTLFSDYKVQVIKDQFPKVELVIDKEGNGESVWFISGLATDDYGIYELDLVLVNEQDEVERIGLNVGSSSEERYGYFMSLDSIDQKTEFYIEVRDNDALNGYKIGRSTTHMYTPKNADEKLEEAFSERSDNSKELEKILDRVEEMNNEFQKNLEEESVTEKDEWSKKQERKRLEESSKELKDDIESISEKLDDDRLDKAKELLEEIEDLLEKLDRKEENPEDLKMSLEELEEEMKANLELYKQMAFELGVEEALDRLDELAKEEEALADSSMNSETRSEAQDSLNKSFEKLQDRLDELEDDQKDLKNPPDVELDPKELDEANEEMNEASEKANEGKNSESQKSQNSAAEKLKEASKKMKKSLMDAREEQQQEDMEALRAIQENLLQLSFDQELVYQSQLITGVNDPNFRKQTVRQKQIGDDFAVVRDSLNALGERVDQLREKISSEVKLVDRSLEASIGSMEDRNKAMSSQRQREGMTSMNNLALLLSEVLTQMQQQMATSKFGDGACSKPGSGSKPKPGLSKMQAKQKALQQEMAKMKEEMEKGKSKGKKGEQGEGANGSKGNSSEQLAKMAAQQQALREEVQRLAEEAARKGGGLSKELKKLADEMEKVEKDILERNIEAETLKRQEDILSRMLQAENALREQDRDNKREAQRGKSSQQESDVLEEYLKKREAEIEMLRRNNVDLYPYFRSKYSQYINVISK